MTERKKGFIARRSAGIGRYVGRRFGSPHMAQGIKLSSRLAKEALKPKPLDPLEFKRGLDGRYKDGGRARFQEVMRENGVADHQLDDISSQHRSAFIVSVIASFVLLLIGIYIATTADTAIAVVYGAATSMMFLVMLAVAIRHDFNRWQIFERRFGGFREYLSLRPS